MTRTSHVEWILSEREREYKSEEQFAYDVMSE